MLLDDLTGVIESLRERIGTHRASLGENETRTRMALVDPLLMALGWDVSDPAVVTPEFKVSGGWADYALLRTDEQPAATVEAKKLGERLASHQMQMLNYANASGIDFAALTDGDHWELYDVFRRGTLEEADTGRVHFQGPGPRSRPQVAAALAAQSDFRRVRAGGQADCCRGTNTEDKGPRR